MKKGRRKRPLPYFMRVLISLGVAVVIGLITLIFDPQHLSVALITGIIFFGSFLGVYTLSWFLEKKHHGKDEDE